MNMNMKYRIFNFKNLPLSYKRKFLIKFYLKKYIKHINKCQLFNKQCKITKSIILYNTLKNHNKYLNN